MEDLTLFLTVFLSIVIFFMILKLIDYSKAADKYNAVKWIVTDSDVPLFIKRTAKELNIPENYRINTNEEEKLFKEILSQYKEYILQCYFHNNLPLPNKKHIPDGQTYYMYSLCCFLHEHQCDSVFCGYNMHTKTLEYKNFGSWGKPLYDAKYSTSDFAVVFHKVYYLSYLYCKNDNFLNPNGDLYFDEKSIETIIDSGTISISSL